MTRTTKKAAKINETNLTAHKGKKASANLQSAKKEKRYQTALERMQLAILKGVFEMSNIIAKAQKELQRIKETANKLKIAKVEPVSEYLTLKGIFEKDLAHLTEDHFVKEAMLDAQRFVGQAQGIVTAEQEKVIIKYYLDRSRASFNVCNEIQDLLIEKGVLKLQTKKAEKVAQAETANVTNATEVAQ